MKRLRIFVLVGILFLFNIYFVNSATINSAPLNISDGDSVSISGSGFGIKSPAAPWLFDDFESHTAQDGDSLLNRFPKVGTATWKFFNFAGGDGSACEFDNSQAWSGTFSAYQYHPPLIEQTIYVEGQNATRRYISYRFRRAGTAVGTWKIDRTSSGDSTK